MNGMIIFDDKEFVIDVKQYEKRVWDFADQICSDENYMNYMQHQRRADRWKVKQNIIDSKLPECAVNEFLIDIGGPDLPDNPDFRVYDKKGKSWAPDLRYTFDGPWTLSCGSESIELDTNQLDVAVKSCTRETANKYGASFVFNIGTDSKPNTIENAISGAKHDGCDELFISGKDQDVVAFVLFDRAKMECELRGFASWTSLKNDYKNAFGQMRLPKFRTIKTAVYDSYLQSMRDKSEKYSKLNVFFTSCGVEL